ncbi:hypothetical protein RvY_12990 [Ramazzottius varieornatus]|uniref:Uncharacterized protein n=1 Tax=Ramazzottius varieornatus TaxID=947166 RepID=A0A1D1VNA9_RAMVA|nr:hypothetical protein RvY_12990 [Ramazzottius varieornatus]
MIHLPGSRVEINSDADFEACKKIYLEQRAAEKRKKEEEERRNRPADARITPEAECATPSNTDSKEPDAHGRHPAAPLRRTKKLTGITLDGTPSPANYTGPVTRQRQRASQAAQTSSDT